VNCFMFSIHCFTLQCFCSSRAIVVAVVAVMVVVVTVWLNGNIVGHINEVTLHLVGLVLSWVTDHGYTVLVFSQATQPGHPSLGRRNEH